MAADDRRRSYSREPNGADGRRWNDDRGERDGVAPYGCPVPDRVRNRAFLAAQNGAGAEYVQQHTAPLLVEPAGATSCHLTGSAPIGAVSVNISSLTTRRRAASACVIKSSEDIARNSLKKSTLEPKTK